MQNDEVFKKLIDVLHDDLAFYADMIKEVSKDMIEGGYTNYPVFVAHQHQVNLGEQILSSNETARDFNINATTLEELIEKKLVLPERENEFKQNYKNPKQFMCVLLITVAGAHFIFAPYKLTKKNNASA
ncbi:MAG: hypothetical protein ACK4K9_03415 [Bacteroidia bacterium]